MSAVKTAAREIIERLPEDADWEELMYRANTFTLPGFINLWYECNTT